MNEFVGIAPIDEMRKFSTYCPTVENSGSGEFNWSASESQPEKHQRNQKIIHRRGAEAEALSAWSMAQSVKSEQEAVCSRTLCA